MEHRGNAVQDELTQDIIQTPDQAFGIVGCEEGRGDGQQHIGYTQVAQIHVDGGEAGDAPQEHPESECIPWEGGEEEQRIDGGKEI